MNLIEEAGKEKYLCEKEKLGLDAYRRQCLQGLKLKTVIKVIKLHAILELNHTPASLLQHI